MDKNVPKITGKIEKDLQILSADFQDLEALALQKSTDALSVLDGIFQIFLSFEETYLSFRALVFDLLPMLFPNRNSLSQKVIQNFSEKLFCKISSPAEGIIRIDLPPLLHKKVFQKLKKSESYVENYYTHRPIFDDLKTAIQVFIKTNSVAPYTEKCVLFVLNIRF